MLSQQYKKGIEYFTKAISIIPTESYCRVRMFYCYSKLKDFKKGKEILNNLINDAKKSGIPPNTNENNQYPYSEENNGTFDDYFECILNYYEYLITNDDKIIDKLVSYDKNKSNVNWFARAISVLMESLGKELHKDDKWMEVSYDMLSPINDGPLDKNAPSVKTSTWGERAVSMFIGLFICYLLFVIFFS